MIDFGTVRPGTTLYIPFATYDSNDPSASVTLTGLATTDIEVYKNGSVTQRSSDSGYALLDTDGIDFDTITGIHGFSIDLSDNTDAGFWAAGAQYTVVVSSITVDAATINFIAATFRIGYPDAMINTTIATLASQTSFTLTAGPAEASALVGCPVVIHDVASAVQIGHSVISAYAATTKTVTLAAGTTFTAAAGDNIAIYPPANTRWAGAVAWGSGAITAGAIASNAITSAKIAASAIGASQIATDAITAAKIAADAIGASELAADAVAEIQSGLATSTALATVDANVDLVLEDTGTTIPAILGTPSDLGGGATLAANNTDMAGATFSSATDSQEAIRDNLSSGSSPQLLQNTTIATLATQTSFTLTAGSADNDAYNGAVAIFTDQTTGTQKAFVSISDYVGSTKTVTLSAAPAFTIATGDTIDIVAAASDAPTAAAIRAEIDSNSTQLAAIVEDTGTTIPGILGTPAGADLATDIAANQTDLDAILVDLADGTVVAGTVNDKTGYSISGTLTTLDALDTQQDAQHTTTQAAIGALNDPTAAAIADAVWDEAKAGHVAAGSFGEEVQAHALTSEVAAVETDTQDIQSRLPAALVGGRMDSTVDATGMESGATGAIRDAILDRLLAGNHDTDGTVGFVLQLLQADKYTDTSVTPWDLVYMKRGTGGIGVGTELLRHNLTQSDASNVTSTAHVVANAIE